MVPCLPNVLLPSWHSDVVTTVTVENDSCADVSFRRCDKVAVRRCEDVDATLLQRRHDIKHWIFMPFYYRLF